MTIIQCDSKECIHRTPKDFCELKEIETVLGDNNLCKSFKKVKSVYEVVLTVSTEYFAKMCSEEIFKKLDYNCEIRKK